MQVGNTRIDGKGRRTSRARANVEIHRVIRHTRRCLGIERHIAVSTPVAGGKKKSNSNCGENKKKVPVIKAGDMALQIMATSCREALIDSMMFIGLEIT